MPNLTARFSAIDEISDKMERMANSGQSMAGQLENAGEIASSALDGIAAGAGNAVSSVDGIATAIEASTGAANEWMNAASEQEQMLAVCDMAARELSESLDATAEAQDALSATMDAASEIAQELAWSDGVSAEAKTEFARASAEAEAAMQSLTEAQQEAEAAAKEYDEVLMSGTEDMAELENAAERAGTAAENLAAANGRATEAAEELQKATERASSEMDNAGHRGVEAIQGVVQALTAAGITTIIKETAEAVYDLADAFSDAEKIIVNATGATKDALEDLDRSAIEAWRANDDALNDVAGATGEINTRMHLVGEELTETTGKFLDFADITNQDVVGSVQNVTKVLNKYNKDAGDLEDTMDKLAYAGQISGAAVSTLESNLISGAAVFQQMNMTLDNSIKMLADFELYGINGATAITALRTAIKNFSDEGRDARTALAEVIDEIATMEDKTAATSLAVEVFGSRTGVEMVNAIQSGAITIESFTGTLDEANGTLARTAEAGESLGEKWQKASNNIKAAFTTALQPTVDELSSGLADIVNGIGDFLNEHPEVVKALAAVGVGVGVVAARLAVYTVGQAAATAATALFGTTLSAAIWPLTLVAAGIAAVTGAVMILKDGYDKAYDETMSMTAVTAKQTERLEELNKEYEETCRQYGETSDEANRLRYEMDDLSASIDENGKSVQEFLDEIDAALEEYNQFTESSQEARDSINDEMLHNLALIQKLEDLAAATDTAAGSQSAMEAIIRELNSSIDGLNLSYDDLVNNQSDNTLETLEAYARAVAKQKEQNAIVEEYVGLVEQASSLEKLHEEALADKEAAAERAAAAIEYNEQKIAERSKMDATGTAGLAAMFSDEQAAAEAASDELEEVTSREQLLAKALDEIRQKQEELQAEWTGTARLEEIAADGIIEYDEAVSYATDSVQADLQDLAKSYDAAFTEARTSIDGMIDLFADFSESGVTNNIRGSFGVFDELEVKAEKSAGDLVKIMEEQTNQLNNYAGNLSKAARYGVDEDLLEYLSDGSTESMANLETIVAEIERLGWTTSGAKEYVDELNNAFEGSQAAQDYFTTAETSAEDLMAALQSQTTYLETYTENIRKASELGLNEGILASLSDGSEESAAQLQAIIDKVNELGGSSTAAKNFVTEMNDAFADVETAKDEFAGTIASMETDFDGEMAKIEDRLEETVENLSMEDEARDAAEKTISAYTQAIRDGVADAQSAAGAIASAVANVLGGTGTGSSVGVTIGLPAHASGTTYGESAYIAGEDGPELIVGAEGSTVYSADETSRILDRYGARSRDYIIPPGQEPRGGGSYPQSASEQVKRVVLEVAGSGSIEVSGGRGLDKEAVLAMLYKNLKPVLIDIIEEEIYEEGDRSYDF